MRGVSPQALGLYESRFVNGVYHCLSGGQQILGDSFNDDYCHCLDGSDEPGTSACSWVIHEPTFWCPMDEKHILPSHVDDGICDCCDGSDEAVVECPENCRADDVKHDAEVMSEGLHEKARRREWTRTAVVECDEEEVPSWDDGWMDGELYVAPMAPSSVGWLSWLKDGMVRVMARLASPYSTVKGCHDYYGPDQMFVSLEGKCVKDRRTRDFEICFFDQFIHKRRVGPSWIMDFVSMDYYQNIMTFSGGPYCPYTHGGREMNAKFVCGTKEAILEVRETQECVYEAKVATPLVCEERRKEEVFTALERNADLMAC